MTYTCSEFLTAIQAIFPLENISSTSKTIQIFSYVKQKEKTTHPPKNQKNQPNTKAQYNTSIFCTDTKKLLSPFH